MEALPKEVRGTMKPFNIGTLLAALARRIIAKGDCFTTLRRPAAWSFRRALDGSARAKRGRKRPAAPGDGPGQQRAVSPNRGNPSRSAYERDWRRYAIPIPLGSCELRSD